MNKFLRIGVLTCILISSTSYTEAGLGGLFGARTLMAKSEEASKVYSGDYKVIITALNNYQTQVKKIKNYVTKLANAGKSGNNSLTKDFAKSLNDENTPNAAFSVCLMMVMNLYSALTAYLQTAVENLSNSLNKFAKSTTAADVIAQGKIIVECAERLRAASYMAKIAEGSLSKFIKLNSKIKGRLIIGQEAVSKVLVNNPLPEIIDSCKVNISDLKNKFEQFQGVPNLHINDDCAVISNSLYNIQTSFSTLLKFTEMLNSFIENQSIGELTDTNYIDVQNEEEVSVDEDDEDDDYISYGSRRSSFRSTRY